MVNHFSRVIGAVMVIGIATVLVQAASIDAAQRAGTSLIMWIGVSSQAQGERIEVPDAVRAAAVQDLLTISSESWNANHTADERKRATAVNELKNRLKWKTWDEIQ